MKTPEILVPSYQLYVRESDGRLVVLSSTMRHAPAGHREPTRDEQDEYVSRLVRGGE